MLRTYLVYNTDRYYDRKKSSSRKKRSSHLSGRCVIVITTGKKKFKSSVWQVRDLIMTGKKSSSHDFYAKLNVSNLNVTNLY